MTTNPSLKEKRQHGTLSFGFSCYHVEKQNKPFLLRDHWHPELELLHIVRGESILHLERLHRLVKSGDIILFRPNQLHGMTWCKPSSEEFAFDAIVFSPDLIKSYSSDIIEINNILPIIDEQYQMQQLFDNNSLELINLFQTIINSDRLKKPFYQIQIKALLLMMMGKVLADQNSPIIKQTELTKLSNERAKKIIDFIHNNYQNPLTLEIMAKIINVSVSTFCRLFSANFDDTFSAYLMKLRIANSMDELQKTQKSITDIALDNGFESSSYFGFAFKKFNGISPSKFRKNMGSSAN